ncbi:60S ribosomal protein L37 [Sporothrix bragantina]|uniref:60S ribosomal protein L37 n=1 Tax=Sporothrix bragantina TaxID=671064 RepID=A0ABP0BW28_9PEZI
MASSVSVSKGLSSTSGPEVLIPEGLRVAFKAAEDARLLTVHGIGGVGCGWLTIRFLGDWLRKCTFDPETGKSDIGIVVCAFKHSIEYYIEHLQPFGIDLAWHVEKGHVAFSGNHFQSLIAGNQTKPATPALVTFEATLDLLKDRASEMRAKYDRTVLLLDNPEMGILLSTDEDDTRVNRWLDAVDNATYNYDNAIVGMVVDVGQPMGFPVSHSTASASSLAVGTLNLNSQMSITFRPNNGMVGFGKDGRVSVVYRMDYHVDVGEEVDEGYEEDHNVRVANGGHIEILGETY